MKWLNFCDPPTSRNHSMTVQCSHLLFGDWKQTIFVWRPSTFSWKGKRFKILSFWRGKRVVECQKNINSRNFASAKGKSDGRNSAINFGSFWWADEVLASGRRQDKSKSFLDIYYFPVYTGICWDSVSFLISIISNGRVYYMYIYKYILKYIDSFFCVLMVPSNICVPSFDLK